DQDLLVAQVEEKPLTTERFQVAILDAASGRKLSEATIILPAGVQAFVADWKANSFQAVAEREGATYLVSWYYQESLANGITRPGEPTWRFFAGSARISLETGKVIASDGGLVGDVPGRWRTYGSPPRPPWQSGTVSAQAKGGRGGPLTLKRNDAASGRPLPDQV